jgi:hypothetical protein
VLFLLFSREHPTRPVFAVKAGTSAMLADTPDVLMQLSNIDARYQSLRQDQAKRAEKLVYIQPGCHVEILQRTSREGIEIAEVRVLDGVWQSWIGWMVATQIEKVN